MGKAWRQRRRLKLAKKKGIEVGFTSAFKSLAYTEVTGFNASSEQVGLIKARVKIVGGWITPRQAKKMLADDGAVTFKRVNVWRTNPRLVVNNGAVS